MIESLWGKICRFVGRCTQSRFHRIKLASFFAALCASAAAGAQMTVSWDDNSATETGFKIERAADGGAFAEIARVPANTTSYVDTGTSPGTIYWYRISAYNEVATSLYSNIAGATAADGNTASYLQQAPGGASKLVNLSARAIPGQGDKALIVGFVVSGGKRTVLLRAVGPGLARYTTETTMPDPLLTVQAGNVPIWQNDNWGGGDTLTSAFSQLGAFSIPSNSEDAALLADFDPRDYTVLITGAGSGLAMAEIYDADVTTTLSGKLLNLSARAQTGTGDGVLIVGFVITGSKSLRVLLRAAGPSLAALGVPGVLADPQLDLFRGSLQLDHNDDWRGDATISAAFEQAGAFRWSDLGSKDAAIVASLPPGPYTAIISGVRAGTGVALAEVYALP